MVLEGRHVHAVEELLSAKSVKMHVSRVVPNMDSSLDVTMELKEVASLIRLQGEQNIDHILDIGSCNVLVRWGVLKSSWEAAVSKSYGDAPKFVGSKFKRMELPGSGRSCGAFMASTCDGFECLTAAFVSI